MISHILLRFALFLAAVGMLVACGNASAPAAHSTPADSTAGSAPAGLPATAPPPAATRAPASGAAPAATLASAPTAVPQLTPAAAESAIPQGLTAEGYHFLGRADAPATLEMYSDFL